MSDKEKLTIVIKADLAAAEFSRKLHAGGHLELKFIGKIEALKSLLKYMEDEKNDK